MSVTWYQLCIEIQAVCIVQILPSVSNTVDVRKRNVRFGKPNEIWFGYWTFGFQTFGTKPNKPVPNRFGTGLEPVWNWFCVLHTKQFRSDFGHRLKSELFGNGTLFRMFEIRTFGFRTFTVVWFSDVNCIKAQG